MSGGQRARVALARAVYARGETTLLDDPLCALDSRLVGQVRTSGGRGLHTTEIVTTMHAPVFIMAFPLPAGIYGLHSSLGIQVIDTCMYSSPLNLLFAAE